MKQLCLQINQKTNDQIESDIYQDIYQYSQFDNITLNMLKSIILNKNKNLLLQVLSKKSLTQSEKIFLLETICREGNEYVEFFNIFYPTIDINKEIIFSLIDKAMLSNNIKILHVLFENHINIIKEELTESFLNRYLQKNSDKLLIDFLLNHVDKSMIFTKRLLQDIIIDDNLELFKCYIKNQHDNDYNSYLDTAIAKNAYTIIYYLLSEISRYIIKQKSEYYDDFFDYLISEQIDKTVCFLDKVDNIYLLGYYNLEKLLLVFDSYENFNFLLFDYHLINLPFNNENLKQKIKKFILNKKLKQKLIKKNTVTIKKI